MAVIEFLAAAGSAGVEYYIGGESGASRVVGNDYRDGAVVNRVVRYTITPPAIGASKVSLFFNVGGLSDGTAVGLRYYIGKDPNSHINAWGDSEYTGELVRSADGYSFTAELSFLLIPGITYYLFVFPAEKAYGYYSWYRYGNNVGLSIGLSGGAGIVYVGNIDGSVDMYQIYVGNSDGGADLRLPYCGTADGSADGSAILIS